MVRFGMCFPKSADQIAGEKERCGQRVSPKLLACTPRAMDLPPLRWGNCVGSGAGLGGGRIQVFTWKEILTLRLVRDQARTIYDQVWHKKCVLPD